MPLHRLHLPAPTTTLAILCVAFGLPAVATAESSLSVNAYGGYGNSPATLTAASGPISQAKTGSGPQGSNKSEASAAFGVLRTYGESHVTTGSTPNLIQGAATASWRDNFLINSTLLDGQAGRLTLSMRIDGSLTGNTTEPTVLSGGRSLSRVDYDFRKDGGIVGTGYQVYYANTGQTDGTFSLGQTLTFTVDFTFGTPFEMRLTLQGLASSYSYQGASRADMYADLSHTATWGGFSSVTTAQGVPVPYTFNSTSGTDFAQPIVPEPGTYAMVILASLGTLVIITRHRGAQIFYRACHALGVR